MFLTQNVFPQGKAGRDISLNKKYLILLNNQVDRHQLSALARRIYPTNGNSFMNVYRNVTEKPYRHLVIDLQASTPEYMRLRPTIC